jgi:hypothetical protein
MLNYSMARARLNSKFNNETEENPKSSGAKISNSMEIDADINIGKAIAVVVMFLVMFVAPASIYNSGVGQFQLFPNRGENLENYAGNTITQTETTSQSGNVAGARTETNPSFTPSANRTGSFNNTNSGNVLGVSTASTQNIVTGGNTTLAAILLITGGMALVSASVIYARE